MFVGKQVRGSVDDVGTYVYVCVVVVVRHWHQHCGVETGAEGTSADLPIETQNKLFVDCLSLEHIWVAPETRHELSPIITTLAFFHRLADQCRVLSRINHCLVPVVELSDLGHSVEPWLPERILTFLGFVEKKQQESVCGTLFALVLIKPILVL